MGLWGGHRPLRKMHTFEVPGSHFVVWVSRGRCIILFYLSREGPSYSRGTLIPWRQSLSILKLLLVTWGEPNDTEVNSDVPSIMAGPRHNLVEASFDLYRYLLLGDQLKSWELHPLVSYTSCMILNLLWYYHAYSILMGGHTDAWSAVFSSKSEAALMAPGQGYCARSHHDGPGSTHT